jgi:hypothetical protein
MEPFACVDNFDFDDTAFAPAHRVDGMHADCTIANEPRDEELSHRLFPLVDRARLGVSVARAFFLLPGPHILTSGAQWEGPDCDQLVTAPFRPQFCSTDARAAAPRDKRASRLRYLNVPSDALRLQTGASLRRCLNAQSRSRKAQVWQGTSTQPVCHRTVTAIRPAQPGPRLLHGRRGRGALLSSCLRRSTFSSNTRSRRSSRSFRTWDRARETCCGYA